MERLGELLKSGELKDIVAIPTSIRTKEQAESLDIPLVTLDTHSGTLLPLARITSVYVLFSTCQASTPQLPCEVWMQQPYSVWPACVATAVACNAFFFSKLRNTTTPPGLDIIDAAIHTHHACSFVCLLLASDAFTGWRMKICHSQCG